MRAFPGAFGVMTIVVADCALEVCFLLELVGTFASALVGATRRAQGLCTPHSTRSAQQHSEVGRVGAVRSQRYPQNSSHGDVTQ
jgi:hypothetical protein